MGCGASSSTESVAEAAVAVGSSRPTTINNGQNSAGSTRGYTARNQQTIAISGGGQPVGKRLTLPAPYRHGKPITQVQTFDRGYFVTSFIFMRHLCLVMWISYYCYY